MCDVCVCVLYIHLNHICDHTRISREGERKAEIEKNDVGSYMHIEFLLYNSCITKHWIAMMAIADVVSLVKKRR